MDHLKEAKKFAAGANQTDRAELRSSEALNAIAHALIALVERLDQIAPEDVDGCRQIWIAGDVDVLNHH